MIILTHLSHKPEAIPHSAQHHKSPLFDDQPPDTRRDLSSPGQLQAPWCNVAAGHALFLLWGQTLDCPASCPLPHCSQASTTAQRSQPRESSYTSPLCDRGQIFTRTELCRAARATTSLIVTFSLQLFVF